MKPTPLTAIQVARIFDVPPQTIADLQVLLFDKAQALELSPGQLLLMAREIAHNQDLPSVELITAAETVELILELERIALQAEASELRELVAV